MKTSEDIFKMAFDWYNGSNPTLRKVSLELFSKEELETALQEKKEREVEERKKVLNKLLEEYKKKYPIGTLIWNDDYTDQLPNIICSEPRIEDDPYCNSPCNYHFKESDRKTIVVKTLRYNDGDVLSGNRNICLEKIDLGSKFKEGGYLIDLNEYYKAEEKYKQDKIKKIKKDIREHENKIVQLENKLQEMKDYNPRKLTKERVTEILNEYEKGR